MHDGSPDPDPPFGRNALTIAAVVPATDEPPTVAQCAAALRGGGRRPDELIVQREPRRSGPAAARNAGAAGSAAEVLVFVDADVVVHPDALARIERRFAEEPELDALFGAYDDQPADRGLTSRFRNLLHHHVHAVSAGEAETFWAGLGAVRREAFVAVGGFDERRFPRPSVEDIDLGMRLRDAGARVVLDPEIRGRHLKAWTPLDMVRTDFARRGVPWARILLARGAGGRRSSAALNLGWRHRASAIASVVLLLAAIARKPGTAVGALAVVLTLNRSLYGLLARRGGAPLLLGGIALHVIHQLTAVAALPAALLLHLRDRAAG